jgi:hypothetical protein
MSSTYNKRKAIPVGYHGAEEVVEAADVRHGELRAEGGGDPVEKLSRGGGEDDVIDVQQEEIHILRALKNEQ